MAKKCSESAVREAAYYIWQNAGCPCGNDEYFWALAIEQVNGSSKKCSAKSTTKKTAAKKATVKKSALKTKSVAASKSTATKTSSVKKTAAKK